MRSGTQVKAMAVAIIASGTGCQALPSPALLSPSVAPLRGPSSPSLAPVPSSAICLHVARKRSARDGSVHGAESQYRST